MLAVFRKPLRCWSALGVVCAAVLAMGALDVPSCAEKWGGKSFQTVRPITAVKELDDVRWKDMSKLDLSDRLALPATLWFNQQTVWPPPDKMPPGCDPAKLLADAMNPGLGIRDLHRQGITGKGVNVAIIDQPMYLDHPELAGKIAAYKDVGCGSQSSYVGGGGLSWSIPYCAGVLALGWQLRPDIPPEQMRDLLFQSAHTLDNGVKVINPQELIRLVKSARVRPAKSAISAPSPVK